MLKNVNLLVLQRSGLLILNRYGLGWKENKNQASGEKWRSCEWWDPHVSPIWARCSRGNPRTVWMWLSCSRFLFYFETHARIRSGCNRRDRVRRRRRRRRQQQQRLGVGSVTHVLLLLSVQVSPSSPSWQIDCRCSLALTVSCQKNIVKKKKNKRKILTWLCAHFYLCLPLFTTAHNISWTPVNQDVSRTFSC